MNKVPRRSRLDYNHDSELAIRKAIHEVEKLGADPKLTTIVMGLSTQLANLADYLDTYLKEDDLKRDVHTLSLEVKFKRDDLLFTSVKLMDKLLNQSEIDDVLASERVISFDKDMGAIDQDMVLMRQGLLAILIGKVLNGKSKGSY